MNKVFGDRVKGWHVKHGPKVLENVRIVGSVRKHVSAHPALHPDELVSYPEAWMSFRVDHNFSKEWIFVIRPAHNLCKVEFSLYVHT